MFRGATKVLGFRGLRAQEGQRVRAYGLGGGQRV